MNRLTTHDVECIITEIVGKREPIGYNFLSTVLYIIESFFHMENKDLPIDFSLTKEGIFSNDLEYFLQRLCEKNKIELQTKSPLTIKLKEKGELEIAEKCLMEDHNEVFERITYLLKEDICNDDYVQFAKVIRAHNILSYGIITSDELENRFRMERVNIEKMKSISTSLKFTEINDILT